MDSSHLGAPQDGGARESLNVPSAMHPEASAPLFRLTLVELYQLLIDGASADAPLIRDLVNRGLLAESLLAPVLAGLTLEELLDLAAKCREEVMPVGAATSALEVTARELRRVQLLAIEAEQRRRQEIVRAVRPRTRVGPRREVLLGRVQKALDAAAHADGSDDAKHVREIAAICQREKPRSAPGAMRVAAVLVTLNAPRPDTSDGEPVDEAWLGSAVALRLLTGASPYASGRTLNVELDTRAAAAHGLELMLDVRRDGGSAAQPWRLDLDGRAVAVLLEQRAIAAREWARQGYPQQDQALYEDLYGRHLRGRTIGRESS